MRSAALVLGCLWVVPAAAQSPAERRAAQIVDVALERVASGDYEDAARLFLQAYALDPRPELLVHAGRALRSLGRIGSALNLYERFLAEAPQHPDAPAIRREIDRLRPRAWRTHGEVEVVSDPPGARIVREDTGQVLGRAPLRVWLPHGTVVLRIEPRTGPPRRERVMVRPEQVARVEVRTVVPSQRSGVLGLAGLLRGDTVIVDGRRVMAREGVARWRVRPGPHRIRVERAGHRPFETEVVVAPGGEARVAVEPVPARPLDGTEPVAPGAGRRTAGWVLLGLGIAGLVGGAGLHAFAVVDGAALLDVEDGRIVGAVGAEGVGVVSLAVGLGLLLSD